MSAGPRRILVTAAPRRILVTAAPHRILVTAVVAAAATASGCADAPDQRLAIVTAPRVLAISAEPAEARPGTAVTYRALVASPAGTLDASPRWSYCTAPKPPTEDNAVATGCITGDALEPLGTAPSITAALPADACIRFGPEVPPGNFRPRDPDSSGGFYQPLRVDVDADAAPGDAAPLLAFGLSRITCKLPNATADLAHDYEQRYVANRNPTLDDPSLPATVPAHTAVELSASWPAGAAEPYLYFDQLAQALVPRRESLRVSWFATAGALDVDATAIGETELATRASTTWHTPAPGPATLWFVLRDSRGGIATRTISVTVD